MESIKKDNKRDSNIELLRILAMFLIVLHHCTAHGVFWYWNSNNTVLEHINNFLCVFLSSGGKVGVTIFVLISGYFLCTQEFKLSRYSVSSKAVLNSLMPFTRGAYWFITTYMLLYIFMPFLNVILKHINAKKMAVYVLLGTIFWVIVPMISHADFYYSLLLYFFYLYLLGGSIRLGYINLKQKYLVFGAIAVTVYLIANILIHQPFGEINMWRSFKYMELNTIYTLGVSLFIFNCFTKLKLGHNKLINYISASTFGVYLMHENMFVRDYLWHKIFHVHTLMADKLFAVEVILISLLVFFTCVLFDKIFDFIKKKLPLYIEELNTEQSEELRIYIYMLQVFSHENIRENS